jgi:phosphoglycerol transferase
MLADWMVWLPGSAACFLLASILMTGWPAGLIPNLEYPYIYFGDALSYSWLTQRAMEGWIFDNDRSGYPFGSNFLDYPSSDSGNFLVLKACGLLTGDYYGATNLYFLLGFAVCFACSYGVMRSFGVSRLLSVAAAMLFTFLPFHIFRIAHLTYTWYFPVPLFYYLAFRLFSTSEVRRNSQELAVWSGILLALSSFGAYYALFGVIMLLTAALAIYAKTRRLFAPVFAIAAAFIVIAGVAVNLAPSIAHRLANGENLEVAQREASDSEIYALRMTQLVLPSDGHRLKILSDLKAQYNDVTPYRNESRTSSLGAVGTLGFFILGAVGLLSLVGGKVDTRLGFLAIIVTILFLFGTVGGFGALFSYYITALIRGWNRISVFIAFGAIAAFFLALQLVFTGPAFARRKWATAILTVAVLIVGLLDQTRPVCLECNQKTKAQFQRDRTFIREIERALPRGSAVYQLPYMPFPEVGPQHRLGAYDHTAGYLHSSSLKWSYGGMKGREGDFFYRSLAREPLAKQIGVIRRIGFAGIYVDRRGYADNAAPLVDELTTLIGPPSLVREDQEALFFEIPRSGKTQKWSSAKAIMRAADYFADSAGVRYTSAKPNEIDFTVPGLPDSIYRITGLSVSEPWGRWSDATLDREVRIRFVDPLPQQFTLHLSGRAFGPNVGEHLLIRIGSREYRAPLAAEEFETSLAVTLHGESTDLLVFRPPRPTSPRAERVSPDTRELGIGFVKLRIETSKD